MDHPSPCSMTCHDSRSSRLAHTPQQGPQDLCCYSAYLQTSARQRTWMLAAHTPVHVKRKAGVAVLAAHESAYMQACMPSSAQGPKDKCYIKWLIFQRCSSTGSRGRAITRVSIRAETRARVENIFSVASQSAGSKGRTGSMPALFQGQPSRAAAPQAHVMTNLAQ